MKNPLLWAALLGGGAWLLFGRRGLPTVGLPRRPFAIRYEPPLGATIGTRPIPPFHQAGLFETEIPQ